MAEEAEANSFLKYAAWLLAGAGALIQGAGYFVYLKGLFATPFYALIVCAVGYLLLLSICVERFKYKRKRIVSPLDRSGQKEFVYNLAHRVAAIIIAILATIALALLAFKIFSARRPEVLTRDEHEGQYKVLSPALSAIEIMDAHWQGETRATPKGTHNSIPFAEIVSANADMNNIDLSTVCALRFDLKVRPSASWAQLDEIRVHVQSFQPLPEYTAETLTQAFRPLTIYYAEIDNPSNSHTDTYRASYYFPKGEKHQLGVLQLEPNKPEPFLLIISAKTPGIYKISCDLLIRTESSAEKIEIEKSAEYLFDGNSSTEREKSSEGGK